MINSLTYLTRACPRNCEYCALVEAKGVGEELTPEQWERAFDILRQMSISFNLILGNETWLLGEELAWIMMSNEVPYAIYTTCPEPLFTNKKLFLIGGGVLDNLSCGVDYPLAAREVDDDSYRKSLDAWKGLMWARTNFPEVDTQGTMTIHRENFRYVSEVVKQLSEIGVNVGLNFIHYNKGGGFDFFPNQEEIQSLLFTEEDIPELLEELKKAVTLENNLIQNPGFIQYAINNPDTIIQQDWHCEPLPYGGPTIDSDGSLRCCGYRKGLRTPEFTVFDLPHKWEEVQEAMKEDVKNCPGCFWSYPFMYHEWKSNDPEMGKKVFTNHAGTHIPEEKWNERKTQ